MVLENFLKQITPWFLSHGIRILGILIAAFLVKRFSHIFIEKLIRKVVVSTRYSSRESEKKREDTLISIFSTTLSVLLVLITGLMVLSELGVDTTPIIASAGIAGIAVGFGGQYLIRDVISGFFIILENQYRVGDVITIADTSGLVENISLRITTLRDLDGAVHYVPNGEVKVSSNLSKTYSRVNLDIGISYSQDLDKAIKVINEVGNNLAKDKDWKDLIIKPPQFLRVDNFADSAVVLKILGETEPLKQWDATGELRKRLKIAFDKNNIEIPFPQRVIHIENTSKN